MITKHKKTFFDINMYKTNNKIGINEDDYWCKVNLIADNYEFHYEVSRESITKNETIKALNYLKDYYYKSTINTQELSFIKNYFILIFHEIKNNNKLLELKLISLLNKQEKSYSLFFENEEIEEFIHLIQNFSIFNKR
ncbi:MAG: hypothetical protein PUD59_00255 [bacterium]|nr:hypothetical protein [bacterium]